MIAPRSTRATTPLVSVVLPQYNEADVLERLVALVEKALQTCESIRHEIVFVNDGSTDDSGAILDQMAHENPALRVVHFSRNFGHQAAVKAGLDHARGDCVIVMDSDLQDDPQAIVSFVEAWRDGHDVVYAERTNRKENPVKRFLFYSFYRILNSISDTPIPNGSWQLRVDGSSRCGCGE